MMRILSLAGLLCALLLMTSCATPLDLSGPYSKQLSQKDIQEIKVLVSERSDIKKPVFKIWADRSNNALVRTGRDQDVGDVINEFRVAKQNGRWQVTSKITEEHIIAKVQ